MKLIVFDFLLTSIGVFVNLNANSQRMNLIYKKLNINEFNEYLKDKHGQLVSNPYFDFCNFYECDSNSLVIENIKEKNAVLYYDRLMYYKKMDKVRQRKLESPLKNKQELIINIEKNKKELIRNLFEQINATQNDSLSLVNLKELDNSIKAYGYEKAYNSLLLNLIVFAGEYIRLSKAGNWIKEKNKSYPSELMPIFTDSNGRKYDFDINIRLQKDFLENGRFSIAEIINFSLLPKLGNGSN